MRSLLFICSLCLPILLLSQEKAENWGGRKELKRIFDQELYYAPNSLEKQYGGKVKLGFEVSESGEVSKIEVLQSVSRELNAEATRLLKLLMWYPAKERGETIASKETISFKFNPIRYDALCNERGYRVKAPSSNFIFRVYEESKMNFKPAFSGPTKSFKRYINANLKYPADAIKTGAQGIVEVKFIVEPSGRLTNIHISKSLEANCDIGAKKLILDSQWRPGSKNGIPVRTLMTRQFYFSPGDGNKEFYLPGD